MNVSALAGYAGLLIAPALLWGAFHCYKDRHQPEPVANLVLIYALGVLGGFAAELGYESLDFLGARRDAYELARTDTLSLFLYAVLVIGPLEELMKFLPFWLVGMRLRHFDETMDGVIYAAFAALGFATYENFYFFQALDGWEAAGRAFVSPIVHVLFASIWGYACSRAQMAGRALLPAAVAGVALAAFVHGIYDFFALRADIWARILPPSIVLAMYAWRMVLLRRLKNERTGK
jgi:RsiW-degrading membrane proteinase PrsW (M82 family)